MVGNPKFKKFNVVHWFIFCILDKVLSFEVGAKSKAVALNALEKMRTG